MPVPAGGYCFLTCVICQDNAKCCLGHYWWEARHGEKHHTAVSETFNTVCISLLVESRSLVGRGIRFACVQLNVLFETIGSLFIVRHSARQVLRILYLIFAQKWQQFPRANLLMGPATCTVTTGK